MDDPVDDAAWLAAVEEMLAPERAVDPSRVDLVLEFVATGARRAEVARLQPLTGVQFDQVPDGSATVRAISTIDTTSEARALRFMAMFSRLFSRSFTSEHPALAGIPSVAIFVEKAGSIVSDGSEALIPLDLALVEDLLRHGPTPPHAPLLAAFSTSHSEYRRWNEWTHTRYRETIRRFQGYDAAVARNLDVLRPCLAASDFADRLAALEALTAVTPETLRLFVPELATAITETSAKVAAAAAELAAPIAADLVELLQGVATSGRPPARAKALRFLHANGEEPVRSRAETTAAADRAPAVRALLEEWAAEGVGPVSAPTDPEIPPTPMIDWRTEVPASVRAQLHAIVERLNVEAEQQNERDRQRQLQFPRFAGPSQGRIPLERLDAVLDGLAAGRAPAILSEYVDADGLSYADRLSWQLYREDAFPELGFFGCLGLLTVDGGEVRALSDELNLSHAAQRLWARATAASGGPSPLEVSAALDELGHDGGDVLLTSWRWFWSADEIRDLDDEMWAPFVLTHLDKVLELVGQSHHWGWGHTFAYTVLAVLPQLPERAVALLLDLGLRGPKPQRRLAQDVLAVVPDLGSRVSPGLADSTADVRREAASWLARIRPASALPVLESALAKERDDVATGAMLDALEALGQPVEKYLDRAALLVKAEQLATKGLPAALTWFPWSTLPEVRWADTGEPVDGVIVQWLLAQAVKAKNPAPNAVLRRYCAMLDPADREQLGQQVLEAWIDDDLGSPDPATGEPAGSATASKGVLAVVGACAGAAAAPVIRSYLRSWYGPRHPQGRALIQALAWIDHRAAVQLLLSVGSGFPGKSLKQEAATQAEALAERKGWSVLELADRTIPTAGFDRDGRLELPYGDRVFTARLLPDLTCELVSPEGAVVRALPTPRKGDDAERAALSKKVYSAAKRELKGIAADLTRGWYDAMCTGRTWSAEVWSTYIDGHPTARFLTQRLVWSATAADGTVTLFRPLGDGTLTGVDDEPVVLADTDVVAIAHVVTMGAEQARAWQQHLDDYEVTPMLRQLDNPPYPLTGDRGQETAMRDVEGHLISAFALRGRATRRGYRRGPGEDGAVFTTYSRSVAGLDLTVVLEFSGNTLPEEDRTVALAALRFERADRRRRTSVVPLGEVPPVLLAEAYADLTHVAAGGTGFDPDWRSKVQW